MNKLFKLILLLLVALFSINVVSAVTNDSQLYYSYDLIDTSGTTMLDISGNSQDGTCINMVNNCNTIIGKLINASSFDGTNDYISSPIGLLDNPNFSFNVWFKTSSNTVQLYSEGDIYPGVGGTKYTYYSLTIDATGKLSLFRRDDTNSNVASVTGSTTVNDNAWHHLIITYDGTNHYMYLDNVLETSLTFTRGTIVNNYKYLGNSIYSSSYFNGGLDETAIYGRVLSTDDRSELWNSGAGFNPYRPAVHVINFEEVKLDNVVDFNNTDYNSTPQLLEVTLNTTDTNNNTNVTIYLYNSTNDLITTYQFQNNSLTGSYNISFPYEDNFKMSLYAENNETNASDPLFGNYSIGYDITPPNISIIGNITVDTFEVNFSTIFNVTDSLSGLASCTINITYLENVTNPSQFDSLINCTDTQTFSAAGLYNGFIEALDNAGNLATLSVNGTINPSIFIDFFDITNSIFVDDYSVNILSPNGILSTQNDVNGSIVLSPKDNGNLDLGNYTLEFIKFGYPIENFTQLINLTNAGQNFTFNVTPVTLTIQVLDESNHTKQLTFDATLENSTTIQIFNNQINFSQQINNITFGNIIILIESEGYSSRKIFTTILPYTSISFVIHLLNSSLSTPIIFEVSDIAGAIPIEDATLNFFKLIGNATELMGQARTDSQGTTFFNMGIDDEYEIVISADLFEAVTFNSVPGRVLYPILMTKIGAETDFIFNTFGYKFSPTTGFVTSLPFNGSVQVSDNDAAITFMTFTITGTNTSLQTTSTNPSGATLGPLLITNFSEEYLFNLTVIRNGQTLSFFKTITFLNETDSSTSLKAAAEQLQGEENNADRIAMMIIFYVFFVGLGTIIGGPLFGTMAGLIPISLFVMVGWFSATSDVTNAGAGLLLGLFTVMGGLFFNR